MPVNETLSTYSDWAFATTVVIYVVSMLLYFAEFAYGKQDQAGKQDRSAAREKQKVASGGGAAESSGTSSVGHVQKTPGRPLPERLGGMAVSMNVLGVLVHAASLLMRGLSVGRVPWGNMYEFGSSICFAATVGWLVLLVDRKRGGVGKRGDFGGGRII